MTSVPKLYTVDRKTLQKLGFNGHFPRAVTFGSKDLAGLAFPDLPAEQGISHVMAFLKGQFKDNLVGKMMHILLQTQQVESGVGWLLLMDPTYPLPYITASWITYMRDFLAANDMQLEVTKAKTIPLSCKGDCYLMEEIQKRVTSPTDLYDINLCRMYLQVTTLSDITSADGMNISKEALKCKTLTDRTPTITFPRQLEVHPNQITKWRRALSDVFTSHDNNL